MTPRIKKNETIRAILLALLAALVLRQFVIAAYKIPTGSMENTLLIGDFLLVNKFVYGARTPEWIGIPWTRAGFEIPSFSFPAVTQPKSGDIMVFKYPRDPHLDYIKRCVAVGGQVVESRNKQVYINGVLFPPPPQLKFMDRNILRRHYSDPKFFVPHAGNRDNFDPVVVPQDHFFVMGDNRDNSSDSRYWGFVPSQNVVGKPLIIYLSLKPMLPIYDLYHKIRWSRLGGVIR